MAADKPLFPSTKSGPQQSAALSRLQQIALAAVLLLAAFLNLYRLNQVGVNGFGNIYYAAAVKTMLTSWRHFFYLALDPAGFLALDKAPLALWLQTASARIFGFHGLSLLLPQAVAGIVSVYLLYRLVGRAYGPWAGILAALTLATTPITVVINRSNIPDALLILSLLLAAVAMLRAAETGSLRWLLLSAGLVGLGFNIKLLQILLAVPAMALLYLLAASHPWPQRWRRGVLAAVVFLLVAMPWVLVVEWTPVAERPYIGGSTTNSIIELIFGYNGFDRLWGENWSYFLGDPGILRLFNGQLGGQIGWLMAGALGGLMLAIWQYRRKIGPAAQRQRHSLILWAGWLGVGILYFSSSTFYHRYYLATMAPAVAALVGIGAAALWSVRTFRWGKMAWVTAVILVTGPQIWFLLGYPAWRVWLVPLILGLSLVSILLIITRSTYRVAAAIIVLTIFMTPVVWSAIPVFSCTDMTLPTGGPQDKQCRPFAERPFLDEVLVDYLVSNRDGAKFMAATYDMGLAEFGIMETGQPFMALGGYRGSDPILTLDQFIAFVAAGDVRYFISMTEPGETFPQQEAIRQWVEGHCPLVSLELDGIELRGPCSPTISLP